LRLYAPGESVFAMPDSKETYRSTHQFKKKEIVTMFLCCGCLIKYFIK
jgi:hypothetical protein